MKSDVITLFKLAKVHVDGLDSLEDAPENVRVSVSGLTAYYDRDIDQEESYPVIANLDYNAYEILGDLVQPGQFAIELLKNGTDEQIEQYNSAVLKLARVNDDQNAAINHMRRLVMHDPRYWESWERGRDYILASNKLYLLLQLGKEFDREVPELDERLYDLMTRFDVKNSTKDYYDAAHHMNDFRIHLGRHGDKYSRDLKQKLDDFWRDVEQPRFN